MESNEADLSAEQSLEKEDAWLPCAHEDEGRPPCFEEKAPARQEENFGIRRQGHFGGLFLFSARSFRNNLHGEREALRLGTRFPGVS